MATKNASEALIITESKSPDIVSLIALVIANPGTKSIIEPIIVWFIWLDIPNLKKIIASKAVIPPQMLFMKKVLIPTSLHFNAKPLITKPIKNAENASLKLPPNKIENDPAANPEKSITIRNEYVLRLFILSNSLLKSETDYFIDCILLDKSLTLSILSKFTVLFDTRLVKE